MTSRSDLSTENSGRVSNHPPVTENAPNIVKAMLDFIPNRPWGPVDQLHASDLSAFDTGCPYQVYLRIKGAEKRDDTVGERLMFDHAHRLHEDMYEALAAKLELPWVLLDVEQPVEWGGITGRYDARITDEKRIAIVDLKTMRGRAFSYLNGPKPESVLQMRFYLAAADADFGIIVYRDREGSNLPRQYLVMRNDEAVASVVRKALPVLTGTVPQRIERTAKGTLPWQCNYCRYYELSCDGARERAAENE